MVNDNKKILVLIDSNAIIHRAYHALPKNMSTSKGELTNAVYGYTTTLIKVLEDLKPDYIAASFDVGKATERLAQYAQYKATRVTADQELYDQIPKVKELLNALNIPIYEKEGYEADDCIGTISDKFESRKIVISTEVEKSSSKLKDLSALDEPRSRDDNINREDFEVYIISGDKDIFQLVDGNILVYWLKKGLSEAGVINRKVIEVEWGLQPEDFIDLKALAGDVSDNIPGVPGIGPKTATDLLKKFDTLIKLYHKIESLLPVISTPRFGEGGEIFSKDLSTPTQRVPFGARDDKTIEEAAKEFNLKPRIVKLLLENKEQAFMSQKLATIDRHVPIDFKLEDCKWGDYDKDKLREFFERMQFNSLLKRFDAEKVPTSDESGSRPESVGKAKEQREKDKQLKLL